MRNPVLVCCALALVAACGDPRADQRGRSCASDAACGELLCAARLETEPADLEPLALSCGDALGEGRSGDACATPDDCDRGICLLSGACARSCTAADDCAQGERCQEAFARTSSPALQRLSACTAHIDLPSALRPDVAVTRLPLSAGRNEIELPAVGPGELGLYVLEHRVDGWPRSGRCRPPLCVREMRSRDPEPILLFSAEADYASGEPALNPIATGDHLDPAVVMLPSAERSALSPFGYTLVIDTEQAGELSVTRSAGPATALAGARRLDLNLFYVGARELKPEGSRGPPLIAEALEQVDEIFGQADIFVGEVRQIEVTGELPQRGLAFPDGDAAQGFAVLQVRFGVYAELPALFRLSAGASNAAVDLFFVADMAPRSGDGEPQAEAGGIPGPLGMHGTGSSGIAIATDMMEGDPQRLGRTLAHELGHYLGLFHTSEADGSVLEGLSDTPECRSHRDLDGDGLEAAECAEAGAQNLMFWATTSGTELSAQQRAILRAALILHES